MPVAAAPLSASPALGQAALLRLMTAQVQMQDPFKPLDQTQMIAQLAQMSQVAGIADMNVALGQIADDLATHTALLARIESQLAATFALAAPSPASTLET